MSATNYTLTFKVNPDLPDKYNANLPSKIWIKEGLLFLQLDRLDGETGENFKVKAEKLALREVRRINVFDGITTREIQLIQSEPQFNYGFHGQAFTGVVFRALPNPEVAKLQDWNSDPSIELKLLLWEKACSETDIRLVYAYLHLLWELSVEKKKEQEQYQSKPLPALDPFEEIPILRNLLLHAESMPYKQVQAYLVEHKTNPERCMDNVEAHLSLAAQRLHIVKTAAYGKILQDIGYVPKADRPE